MRVVVMVVVVAVVKVIIVVVDVVVLGIVSGMWVAFVEVVAVVVVVGRKVGYKSSPVSVAGGKAPLGCLIYLWRRKGFISLLLILHNCSHPSSFSSSPSSFSSNSLFLLTCILLNLFPVSA